MPTNIENRIKLPRLGNDLMQLMRVRPQVLVLLQELLGDFILLSGLDGCRVQRGLAALGRCDGQFGLGVQDLVGMGEFGL